MFATADAQPRISRSQLSPASIIRISIDPIVVIGTLFASTLAWGEALDAPYLLLALIVFSLIFPGRAPVSTSPAALAREIFQNWLVLVLILVFFGYAMHYLTVFPLPVIGTWVVAVPVLLFAAHLALPAVLPRMLAFEGIAHTAVIAGANDLGKKLAKSLNASPVTGMRVIGAFDDRHAERLGDNEGLPLLGNLGALAEYVKAHNVDIIYISLPMASQPRILKLLNELRDTTASIYFAPDIFLSDLIQARMDMVQGIPVVAVCETPFYGINGLIKRASDIVIAILALLVLAPLLTVIAIGVKLSSPGSVLFTQRRYGLDGKQIIVYKFRSMTVSEDGGEIRQATRNDNRVTRFGAFLRRTSLDELPQFVNVLQGRMSVVGPRPHAVAHNETYRKLINGYMVRHKVKPGITGWAQVNGLRGETDTVEKMKARIEHDLAYLRNWSLRLDLLIILRTVLVLLRGHRNAY